jgi:ATP-dependent DNA helicase PIF1
MNTEQTFALETVLSRKNIFLTGPPGTGKSYTLKCIIRHLKDAQKKFAITASTGCSAVLINGQTIHSYLGLGNCTSKPEKIVQTLKSKKAKCKDIQELQLLIIDEISMIDDTTLELISFILKDIRISDEPFGGVQMILVGDFCQLSPVKGNYCFTSHIWQELHLEYIQLTQSMRQKDDHDFQKILQEVRFGGCSKDTFQRLLELKNTNFTGVLPTKLYALNSDVQAINNHMFKRVAIKNNLQDATIVQCFPVIEDLIDFNMSRTYDIDSHIFRYNPTSNDKQANLDDYRIDLMKGLQVMITRNINFDSGLINGTIGKIISLTTASVCIQDAQKKRHVIYYHTDTNENNKTHIKFMPIKLAYAMSIHKSQGATLEAIEVDGSTYIFAPGQLYTALSRAKSLHCIRILNLDKDSFMCHASVKKFYNGIEGRICM